MKSQKGTLDLMNRKLDVIFLVTLGIAISFSCFTLASAQNATSASGQNTTSANESFAGAGTGATVAIVSLIIAISGIIKSLADRGILDKKVGTAAIMAGDASAAIKDSRKLIYDGFKSKYDFIGSTNPEAAKLLGEKIDAIENARKRLEEYERKVQMYSSLAYKLGTKRDNDINKLAGEIPDSIVPGS